jgi:hypothetical protein
MNSTREVAVINHAVSALFTVELLCAEEMDGTSKKKKWMDAQIFRIKRGIGFMDYSLALCDFSNLTGYLRSH